MMTILTNLVIFCCHPQLLKHEITHYSCAWIFREQKESKPVFVCEREREEMKYILTWGSQKWNCSFSIYFFKCFFFFGFTHHCSDSRWSSFSLLLWWLLMIEWVSEWVRVPFDTFSNSKFLYNTHTSCRWFCFIFLSSWHLLDMEWFSYGNLCCSWWVIQKGD